MADRLSLDPRALHAIERVIIAALMTENATLRERIEQLEWEAR